MINHWTLRILITVLAFLPAAGLYAQNNLNDQLTNIGIETNPEFPRPGETVQLSLNDYGSNAFGSEILWYINGEPVSASQNQRKAEMVAGTAGVTQEIEVELRSPAGGVIRLNRSITPVFLDIIIEPQTHVPDFYLGRALPSFGSRINATALVNGGAIDPKSLLYTWRINRTVVDGGTLRGGYKVDFTAPQGDYFTLSLEVMRPSGEVVARRAYDVASVKPTVEFYEYSDLFGLSPLAITTAYIPTKPTNTLQATPYNLAIQTYNDPDILEWRVDSQVVSAGTNPYQLTFARQFTSGKSQVDFHVRNRTQLLQGVKGGLTISY